MATTRPVRAGERTASTDRELGTFLAVTFAISWGLGVGGSVLLGPSAFLIGVFGPLLGALYTARRYQGSTRSVWQPLLRWRLGLRWYVIAVALPLVLVGLAYGLVQGLGGTWEVEDAYPIGGAVLFFVLAIFIAGGPEEPGWRGFALPRLQVRYTALGASLVLGAIWALWHAPLWFMPDLFYADLNYPLYALQILAMSVIYTWLYNTTGGGVLLAVVLHASTNVASAYLAPDVLPQLVLSLLWVTVAAAIVLRHGPHDLAPTARATPQPSI
jgi:uncharacterized protein